MRELTIEWRHLVAGGATCLRCSATGKTIDQVVAELTEQLKSQGINVVFVETELSGAEISQSNMILFNGVPLEDILTEVTVSENCCPSCSCLTGKDEFCRTIEFEGELYEEVPEEVIRKAAFKAIDNIP